MAEATVEANRDSTVESLENFTVSVVVDSGSTNFVTLGSRSSLDFTIESLPTVSLSTTVQGNRIQEAGFGVFEITLSGAIGQDITINIVEDTTNSTATYGTGADWNIASHPLGRMDCNSVTGSSCQFVITAGSTSVNGLIEANVDSTSESDEVASFSIQVDSTSNHLVETGSSSNLMFTIADL